MNRKLTDFFSRSDESKRQKLGVTEYNLTEDISVFQQSSSSVSKSIPFVTVTASLVNSNVSRYENCTRMGKWGDRQLWLYKREKANFPKKRFLTIKRALVTKQLKKFYLKVSHITYK